MTKIDLDQVTHALSTLEWFPEASHPTGVLVASKNLDRRLLLANHLEKLGYSVWTACGGTDAYEIGIRQPVGIEVLLCDADLTDLPAPRLFSRLKERLPGLRCCVMAADTCSDNAREAACLGAVVVDMEHSRELVSS
jgi:DNA-binding NtrC family response regulator